MQNSISKKEFAGDYQAHHALGVNMHQRSGDNARGTSYPPRALVSKVRDSKFVSSLTRSQCSQIARRIRIIERFEQLIAQGYSGKAAARLAGASRSTIWRWKEHDVCPLRHPGGGRPSLLKQLSISPELIATVKRIQLAGFSNSAAWQIIAASADTPEPLRCFLRKSKAIPASLLKATALSSEDRRRRVTSLTA